MVRGWSKDVFWFGSTLEGKRDAEGGDRLKKRIDMLFNVEDVRGAGGDK
jgi:hypothetical protein